MIDLLLEPLGYSYMVKAILMCALVGGTCAFLSCYLMLKGWSLMGDALAHAVVPGAALAYLLVLPYAIGAFFSGLLAALAMVMVRQKTKLREDAVIGIVFTAFFAVGLLLVSFNPVAVNINTIVFGNILAITGEDVIQVVIICLACFLILTLKWRDFMIVFFDEDHARSVGLSVTFLKVVFFSLLSAATVAALQTVGACLVIAMVVTPGATAYLLVNRFEYLILISLVIGVFTSALGAYVSYFIDANSGGLIVCFQTILFLCAFIFAPQYGLLKARFSLKEVCA